MHRISATRFAAIGLCTASFLFVACPDRALAQGGFPFDLVVQQTSAAQAVANGSSVSVSAASLNQPVPLTLTITYTGATRASLGTLNLVGSTAFTVTSNIPPGGLGPGQSAAYSIVFTATTSNSVSSLLTIPYSEATALGNSGSSGFISLGLTGSVPNFVISYLLPPLSNAIPVSDGGTIPFPQTALGSTYTATLAITNTGGAAGVLNNIVISPGAFQTQLLPLLPANLAGGATLQVPIVYSPLTTQGDKATIQIFLAGQTLTINLAGAGIVSQLQYQLTEGGQQSTVSPNQTISVPDTNVGSISTISLNVKNGGSAAATINAIGITGSGFQLTSAPGVPLSLAPNASTSLTFTFTPTQAGTFAGHLQFGNDSFTVSGKGLGALYSYAFSAGSSMSTTTPGGSVFFSPAQVGQTSSTTFTVTNGGTIPGTISAIFIGEANSPFSLSNLPQLPVVLAVGQSASFKVTFAPAAAAAATGTLHLDGAVFTLTASGNPPATLPAFSFTGASGTQAPMQQPAVGLNLAAPYSLPVSGTLTMNVVPDGFSADPAIQFATGGRTVNFTIAANTTSAVFANGNTTIKLQTGSTSGTITLVPSFQTASGAQLTPSNSQNLQFVVPAVAPLLIAAEVTAQSAAGITLAISGVSNSQSLSHLDFTFTPQANFNLSATTLTVPLSGVASSWFESAAAQPFGGQVIVTIPLTLTSNTTSLTTPVNAIAMISITATNNQGTSAPVTVTLP